MAVEDAEEPVVNGQAFVGTDRLVRLNLGCTGTMITNNFVLTGRFCVESGGEVVAPRDLTATLNGQTEVGRRIIQHPSLNYALIELDAPMRINGSTAFFKNFLYTATPDILQGDWVEVQGFGVGTHLDCLANDPMGASSGVMRREIMVAQSYDRYDVYQGQFNGNGVVMGAGDWGGPSWKWFNGIPYQTGVFGGSDCAGLSWHGNPEAFERWVFEVVYGAPVHMPTVDSDGRGLWKNEEVDAGYPEFWERPLRHNMNKTTAAFDPCPGIPGNYRVTFSINFERRFDNLHISTGAGVQNLTGNGTGFFMGNGNMTLSYDTDVSVSSPGVNWMTVQCGFDPLEDGELVCHGARCGTTHDPLQNSWARATNWDPCGGGGFWYYLDYDTEQFFDTIQVGADTYSGVGSVIEKFVPGPVTVRVTTDDSVQSAGIRSLKAVCLGF